MQKVPGAGARTPLLSRSVVLACLATALPAPASAELVDGPPPTFVEKLISLTRAKIDAAIIARPPKLVPPVPIKLDWKLTKVATFDLGGPLAALTSGDVNGDGKAELYAVTPKELVAIGIGDGKTPRILGRVAFTGDPMPGAPRDVVATVSVEAGGIVAAASPWLRGMRAVWHKGALVTTPFEGGFPQCPGELTPLVAGRNTFGLDAANAHYGMHCTDSIVDGDGYPLHVRGTLSLANKLDVMIERCAARGLGCQMAGRHEVAGVGIAWEVADVNRDGAPELVYSGAGAPGDPDVLTIVTLGADARKPRLRKEFTGGGVAGIVVADVDGNTTPDTYALVRVTGSPKVELWRLE